MSVETRAVRKLTAKAMEAFTEKVKSFQEKLLSKYSEIADILSRKVSTDVSVVKLNSYEEELKIQFQSYTSLFHTFDNFLNNTKSDESLKLRNSIRQEFETQKDEVGAFFDVISLTKSQLLEKLSKTTASPSLSHGPGIVGEITNFMLKKELLLTRITSFNDSPETYLGWKSTFQQVVKDLGVSAAEEVDLLIKWLGQESRKHAVSLKSVNIKQLDVALANIWERLDERYGSPEAIYLIAMKKLSKVTKLNNTDTQQWYELADILSEICTLKSEAQYSTALASFDSSVGVMPVVAKLPFNIQEKWLAKVYNYKEEYGVLYPPFQEFVKFVNIQAKIRNDPSLRTGSGQSFSSSTSTGTVVSRRHVFNKKTNVTSETHGAARNDRNLEKFCMLHKTNHSLNKCRVFNSKSLEDRKRFLSDQRICFKCCESNMHRAANCSVPIKCECGSTLHSTGMHNGQLQPRQSQSISQQNGVIVNTAPPVQHNGGESVQSVIARCTQICNNLNSDFSSKSCTKLVLVNICKGNINVKCYAMLDDQSNTSLAKPELFDMLNVSSDEIEYTINSCSGIHVAHGRRVKDCTLSSIDGSVSYNLPTLLECPDIPNNRNEICTPHDVGFHPHLSAIASSIPEIDNEAQILLLIGRDLVEVHHIHDQITGPPGAPFAQKLGLGWVVIGEMCLGKVHPCNHVTTLKTHVLSNGRASLFPPCENRFVVTEKVQTDISFFDPVFVQTPDDDRPGPSQDDIEFLTMMDKAFCKGNDGRWVAPLPFRSPRPRLPNNRADAMRRARSLHSSLGKNPVKKQLMVEFMAKLFQNGHAEIAPPLSGEECWYLPVFGVMHPKKPNQIRAVFDSSAEFQGLSLNSVLLSGPDLTNNLVGVLLRFRRELIPAIADIEQMFYCFRVDEKHRNFLRFLWYKDNDPSLEIVEYRMTVHVFGNSSSPAVASYGLRRSVEHSDSDIKDFVCRNFYVDDGLVSKSSPAEVIDLIQRTQTDLASSGLHLHKIASSSVEVLRGFDVADLAKDMKSLEFESDTLPVQRSLGVSWSLEQDCFGFKVDNSDRPFTKRGILSVVNSLFDPLGFLSPFTIIGKLILRDIVADKCGWDEPVSQCVATKWMEWKDGLNMLDCVSISRSYFSVSICEISQLSLHVFSDASEQAISAVAYLAGHTLHDTVVSFVMGKSKVAPSKGHTIPRLELCGAVLAAEIAQTIIDQVGIKFDQVKFYSDSRIVLGYIHNHSRRFYTYVSNRVQKIRHVSEPRQWSYVPSDLNPADIGSRGASPLILQQSGWLSGPDFLHKQIETVPEFFPVLDPENDNEVRQIVSVSVTCIQEPDTFGTKRFEKFSTWSRLVMAISVLRYAVISHHDKLPCKGWHLGISRNSEFRKQSECFILRMVQKEFYLKEIKSLNSQHNIDKSSSILSLDPFLNDQGLLCVGGRLKYSDLLDCQKHPVIVPGKSYIAKLLVKHFHFRVQHQGRQLTEGAVRDAGYWVTGGKRLVSSLLFQCVVCKKLRGRFQGQKMSDLPIDRVQQAAPFTYVGVDVFGHWSVVSRRTRGGQASSKRWAVLFTCLTIRAVHIEVIDEMSSSAFINALRRFISVRGAVKQFRSDRGTNFVGATDVLGIQAINVEDRPVQTYLESHSCQWVFNPPHSSHMGGSWERMIGIARRILESMLRSVTTLTHDVLVTLMAEVAAIINSRPIVPVSSDSEDPMVLSPAMLLTSKIVTDLTSISYLDIKSLYGAQWKRVQYLAEAFWCKWRKEYLNTLQTRRKWEYAQEPLCVNDVVLLKDNEVCRNEWPMARVTKVFLSNDKKIRTVEIIVCRDGKRSTYVRPVHELILLIKADK